VFVMACVCARFLVPNRSQPGRCSQCGYILLAEGAPCSECDERPQPPTPLSAIHVTMLPALAAALTVVAALLLGIMVLSIVGRVDPARATALELRSLLSANSMTVQHEAVMELAHRGGEELAALLEDSDPKVRRNAYRAARRSSLPDRCERLVAGLFDPNRLVRYEAMLGVEECAASGDQPRLREAIAQETDPRIRTRLERTLERLEKGLGP
jgi:hypothetical protein